MILNIFDPSGQLWHLLRELNCGTILGRFWGVVANIYVSLEDYTLPISSISLKIFTIGSYTEVSETLLKGTQLSLRGAGRNFPFNVIRLSCPSAFNKLASAHFALTNTGKE